jgi:hypothetical protein
LTRRRLITSINREQDDGRVLHARSAIARQIKKIPPLPLSKISDRELYFSILDAAKVRSLLQGE